MELTYMNSLLEDLKGRVERATLRSTNISLFPETVLALVAEIERQREEIAALREALEAVRKEAMRIRSSSTRDEDRYYGIIEIANTAETALNTDDATAPGPETRCQYCGRIDAECICHNALIEVNQPASEPEAPEIKVGDLVEVAKGRHRYVRGHVKEITNHRYHVAFVQIEGELTQAWVWFNADEITFLAR